MLIHKRDELTSAERKENRKKLTYQQKKKVEWCRGMLLRGWGHKKDMYLS